MWKSVNTVFFSTNGLRLETLEKYNLRPILNLVTKGTV